MSICDNIFTPQNSLSVLATSNVQVYDGNALACIATPSGTGNDLNEIIQSIDSFICSFSSHTHVTSDVTLYNGTPTFACFTFPPGASLNDVIDAIGLEICSLASSIATLDCSDIAVSYSPGCYTETSANLCGHLEGIDNVLCSLQSVIPACMGNNLFPDADIGSCDANITGLTDTVGVSAWSTAQTHQGSHSYGITAAAVPSAYMTHSTSITAYDGKDYMAECWVYYDDFPTGTSIIAIDITDAAGGAPTGNVIQVIKVNAQTAPYNKWYRIRTIFECNANQNIKLKLQLDNFDAGVKIYVDTISVYCNDRVNSNPGLPATNQRLWDTLTYTYNGFVASGGDATYGAGTLDVTIEDSIYNVSGKQRASVEETLTMQGTSDNYLDVSSFTGYVVKSVAVAAPAPLIDDGCIRLWKFTTDGVGVTAATDMRNVYPYDGSYLADDSISTRHIENLKVTGAKLENIVGAGTVAMANVTIDAKGRVTAMSSDFNIAAPADLNVLQYDIGSGKWVNVALLGGILPAGVVDNVMRYNGTAWVTSSALKINAASQVQINTSDTFARLNVTDTTLASRFRVDNNDPNVGVGIFVKVSTNTNGIERVLDVYRGVTGLATNGIGARIAFRMEGSVDNSIVDAAYIDSVFSDITVGAEDSYVSISTVNGGAYGEVLRLDNVGNLGLGMSVFGTNAEKTLGLFAGVAPATSPADTVQLYVADHAGAGTASLHILDEEGNTVKIFKGAALTAVDATALSTGGAAVLSNSDQTVLDNMRTRINELEARLQAYGLL